MLEPFEFIGWAAAGLTFLTYYQKTMLRLRVIGIFANLCFIYWSFAFEVYPVLMLHACLLPVNLYRLFQIHTMKKKAIAAADTLVSPLDWLRPLVNSVSFRDGEYVFRRGDLPDRLYYLVAGSVVFEEHDTRAKPGEVFGEVAFLTAQFQRTSSARCEGQCEILALDAADLATLSLQHPAFNFYLMRVLAARLTGGEVPLETHREPFGGYRWPNSDHQKKMP